MPPLIYFDERSKAPSHLPPFRESWFETVQSKLRLKQAELSGTHGRKRAGVAAPRRCPSEAGQ